MSKILVNHTERQYCYHTNKENKYVSYEFLDLLSMGWDLYDDIYETTDLNEEIKRYCILINVDYTKIQYDEFSPRF